MGKTVGVFKSPSDQSIADNGPKFRRFLMNSLECDPGILTNPFNLSYIQSDERMGLCQRLEQRFAVMRHARSGENSGRSFRGGRPRLFGTGGLFVHLFEMVESTAVDLAMEQNGVRYRRLNRAIKRPAGRAGRWKSPIFRGVTGSQSDRRLGWPRQCRKWKSFECPIERLSKCCRGTFSSEGSREGCHRTS